MKYLEWPAEGLVGQYVERFWTLWGELPAGSGPDRIVPDGRTELIWNLADPFHRHPPAAPPCRQQAALIVGQITGPFLVEPMGRIDLVAARLHPWALGAFLGGPLAAELTDRDAGVEEILGTRFSQLREELAGLASPEARVQALSVHLERWVLGIRAPDRRVATAVRAIAAHRGNIPMDELAVAVELSGRHLGRRFREEVGIGPKRLARITRFRRLLTRLDDFRPGAWSRLALDCGCYDQAHLVRDFQAFTGDAPGAFLRRSDPFGDLFHG